MISLSVVIYGWNPCREAADCGEHAYTQSLLRAVPTLRTDRKEQLARVELRGLKRYRFISSFLFGDSCAPGITRQLMPEPTSLGARAKSQGYGLESRLTRRWLNRVRCVL